VDSIRDLRENVHYAPARGQFRIYYIDEVHMLTGGAFNALLKTLEEPPPHVKFIFATTEAHKILPTILSRCQRFDLRRIPAPVIAQHLLHIAKEEGVTLDPLAAHSIAVGAEGGMRDAQSMLDQLVAFCGNNVREQDVLDVFGFTSHHTVSGICGAILNGQTADALSRLYQQAETGKDLSRLLTDVIFHFRNVLVHKVDPEIAARDLPSEIAGDLAAQAAQISSEKLMQIIDQFAEVESGMKWALNKRLYFEIGIIRATQVLGESSLSDVILALRNSLDGSSFTPPAPSSGTPVSPVSPKPEQAPAPLAGGGSWRAALQAEETPAVESGPPVAASPPPPVSVPAVEVPESQPVAGVEAGPGLWESAREEFSKKLPLQGGYAAEATFLGVEGRQFIIGVPEEHRLAAMNLERPNVKAALEEILARHSGQKYSLKVEVRADLVAAPAPEVSAPPPVPEAAPVVEKQPTPKQAKAAAADEAAERQAKFEEEFRNDPLIQEALKLFDARITQSA
jgi:DNA polymerase-3 subunit gamma/tau